jgi:hypothetical protein
MWRSARREPWLAFTALVATLYALTIVAIRWSLAWSLTRSWVNGGDLTSTQNIRDFVSSRETTRVPRTDRQLGAGRSSAPFVIISLTVS